MTALLIGAGLALTLAAVAAYFHFRRIARDADQ